MGIPSRLDPFCIGCGTRFGMQPDVVRSEGVDAFDAVFQVGGELARAERRTVLNAYTVFEKQRQISGHDRLPGHFALVHDVEAKRASVLQLIEAEIPELHNFPCQGPGPEPQNAVKTFAGGREASGVIA